MTTADIALVGTSTPARTRLRMTPRGRRVLAALAAFPVAVAICGAVVGGSAALASRDEGMPAGSFSEITVLPGESLWSIAEEVAPGADPRDVVADIVRLNALENAMVSAGQRLAIPASYAQAS